MINEVDTVGAAPPSEGGQIVHMGKRVAHRPHLTHEACVVRSGGPLVEIAADDAISIDGK